MRKEKHLQAAQIFRVQYALIHRLQALSIGFTDKMIQLLVASGVWQEDPPAFTAWPAAPIAGSSG